MHFYFNDICEINIAIKKVKRDIMTSLYLSPQNTLLTWFFFLEVYAGVIYQEIDYICLKTSYCIKLLVKFVIVRKRNLISNISLCATVKCTYEGNAIILFFIKSLAVGGSLE